MTVVDIARLPALDLAAVDAVAAFQTRVDRKYVVPPSVLPDLLSVPGAHALEIDGDRSFGYESTYFDTPDLVAYLGAVRRRPHRCKVRTRTYLATGTTWLEVKLRDGRGRTVKHRVRHDGAGDELTDVDLEFVGAFDRLAPLARRLVPVLTTDYERFTIIVPGGRVTLDSDVRCTGTDGRVARIVGLVVETKGAGAGTAVDRVLWCLGHRPVTISKFGVGLAALHPELPSNKWHRTLARHVRLDDPV